MHSPVEETWHLSGSLARDLLKAWTVGDPAKVAWELKRSISVPDDPDDASETERRIVLRTVAGRMRTCADLLQPVPSDPALTLWLSLLAHLASPVAGMEGTYSSSKP